VPGLPQALQDLRRPEEVARVMGAFEARPPYQRNDYLWWINTAKQDATKERRLNQMLDELERGDAYMGMRWRSGQRK
jgi:uncharacterized protein YdeI (YjbR/CyaY-like superfamily)